MLRQDQLLTRLARRFSLDREQVRQRLLELRTGRQQNQQRWNTVETGDPDSQRVDSAQFDPKESELLGLVLRDPALVDIAIESVSPGQFRAGPLRELYEQVVELFHDGEAVTRDRLTLEIENPQLKSVLFAVLEEADHKQELLKEQPDSNEEAEPHQLLTRCIQAFERVHEQSRNRVVISRLEQGLQEEEELDTLAQLMKEAQARIRE